MVNLRLISSIMAFAVCLSIFAQSIIPGSPKLTMSFDITDNIGKVSGMVTAPTLNNQWETLSNDVRMNIRVVRSCYALGESDIPVASFTDLAPGEQRSFPDEATPAWQYGYSYTYMAYASIDGNEGYQGYGSVEPGVSFSFGYGTVKATSGEEDGNYFVDITALIPDETNDYPAKPIPVEMTAIEFYRIADTYSDDMELIGSIPNPQKGSTYTFKDTNPTPNTVNHYLVKCISDFGFTEVEVETFVGLDVPGDPYPVVGEWLFDGGYKISWTAPTTGKNNGSINPEEIVYNVYRCWGRADNEKELIASNLTATEYIDYGTDMTTPRAVLYMVEAANNQGVGGSSSSSYNYNVLIGPNEKVPYIENFDNGTSHIWTYANSNYYASFSASSYAEYGDNYTRVEPISGTGLAYVDFSSSWISAGSNASMTSYNIDLTKATTPYLSFYTYMIPDCDVVIKPQIAVNDGDFTDLASINISDCQEAGWKLINCDLTQYVNSNYVNIRFYASFTDKRSAAIIDEVKIIDYPAVGNIEVDYDAEACTATLSWEDPSTQHATITEYQGIVDGQNIGTVQMPWVFNAPEYKTSYILAVKAIYGDIAAPESNPVTISVPRPAYTEFTIDEHIFSIVQNNELNNPQLIIKKYLGTNPLYKAPELITYDDVSYTVVGIGNEAYKDNLEIVSVNLPESIQSIGVEAFANCSNIMAVVFGEGLRTISSRAFANCQSLAAVTFLSTEIPDVADDAFTGIANPCVGKCPEGMEEAYAAITGLAPISFQIVGIDSITSDDISNIEYYDFSGKKIATPIKGEPIIIRTTMRNGKSFTKRVIVK